MEKYTGSYLKFIFKDSKNWIVLLASFIICSIPVIGTKADWPSYFFILIWLLVLLSTVLHYIQRKNGKTS